MRHTMNCMQKSITLALAITAHSFAADFHASPQGAGSKDGSSAANAAPGSELSSLFNDRLQPGDRLVLAAGEYDAASLSLSKGGAAGKPKIIDGAGAILKSNWSVEKPDKGATAISFAPGLSHVTIKNLSIQHYCFAIRCNPGEARTHITLDGLQMEQMRHGIYVSDCDDMTITGVKMKRYSKHGFRFEQGCDRVVLKNCAADASEGDLDWETKTELFTFGYIVNDGGPNTDFRFEDCLATNNMKSNQGKLKYTNGDGFVAEKSVTNIQFIRCRSLRNQDGGFDIKATNTKFVDCVAIGHRRDFRIWADATLENCLGGFSSTGLWSNGKSIVANHCTFVGHRKSALEFEGKPPGTLKITNSLAASGEEKFVNTIGKIESDDTVIFAKSTADIGISAADPKWNGTGSAMDSTKHADKGYSSKRVGKAD